MTSQKEILATKKHRNLKLIQYIGNFTSILEIFRTYTRFRDYFCSKKLQRNNWRKWKQNA